MDGEMVGKTSGRLVKTGCWWIPRFSLGSVKLLFHQKLVSDNPSFEIDSNQTPLAKC